MIVETELKFIATAAAIAALPNQLSSLPVEYATPQTLTNIYFDTEQEALRQQNMGLRIRGCNGQYEMTVKLAGKVTGGLHQRPEYTVSISEPVLDLALFPSGIWPQDCDSNVLQVDLKPLFRTDFTRETWLIAYGMNNKIEVVLDQGIISAGELSEPLCEIELELKQGNETALFALAAELAHLGGLRQENLSKAARGYHLLTGKLKPEIRPLLVLQPVAKASIAEGMVAGLALALDQWQHHERLWLAGESAAKSLIIEAIAMIRQIFVIFGGLVPRKASTELRALLMALEPELAVKEADAQVICYSADYFKCKLVLTSWLVTASWQQYLDSQAQNRLKDSFKRFSDIMLNRSAAELKDAFEHRLDDDAYKAQLPRLTRLILTFRLLSGNYPEIAWFPYIDSWFALQQAITEGRASQWNALRKQALSQVPFWLHGASTY